MSEYWGGAFLIAMFAVGALVAQAAVAAVPFQITSPVNGASVLAGQSVTITVSVASGAYPREMAVIGTGSLGTTEMQAVTGTTVRFSLAVPADTSPDSYRLTAVALDSSGALITSAPININVERTEAPTELTVYPLRIVFAYIGEGLPLTIMGRFSQGKLTDVTRSSYLTIQSEDPSVAHVKNGIVIAVGSGQTHINLKYGASGNRIAVTVPAYVRGDLNGDGRVDQSDLSVIFGYLGWPSNGPHDARDLNGDGVIDMRDAEILKSLCTHPGCASQ